MSRHPRSKAWRAARVAAVSATLITVLTAVVACTAAPAQHAAGDPLSQPSRAAVADPEPAAARTTKVVTGSVVGALPPRDRRRAVRRVAGVVDRWVDAAYLAGRYPRGRFGQRGLRGFAHDTARLGRRDRAVLTNARLGRRIDSVRATQRRVVVDLLAVRGRPVASTARVLVRYRTEGQVSRLVSVRGRLFLRPGSQGWRIFGYDLARGAR